MDRGGSPIPFRRTIPPLVLSPEDRAYLDRLSRARTAPRQQVSRAQFLCEYAAGDSIPVIAQRHGRTASIVGRTIKKAREIGPAGTAP